MSILKMLQRALCKEIKQASILFFGGIEKEE